MTGRAEAATLPIPAGGAWRARLPWIDAFAGLLVGLIVIAFVKPLSRFYSLPLQVLTFTAAANLGYSVLGFGVAGLPSRASSARRALLGVLVVANCTWALICIGLAVRFGSAASPFGLAHFLGEASFVVTLAALEWRHRAAILAAPGLVVRARRRPV